MTDYATRHFALDILIIGETVHGSSWSAGLMKHLRHSPAVRSFGVASVRDGPDTYSGPRAMDFVRDGKVNTIFIHPTAMSPPALTYYFEEFVPHLRDNYPNIVIVIYCYKDIADSLIQRWPRYKNYFQLDEFLVYTNTSEYLNKERESLDAILQRCEQWHETRFEYDVALSFAGGQRDDAEAIAVRLKGMGLKVFYDEHEKSRLLGRDLFAFLHEVYSVRSRYCLMLISRDYADRMWTIHERRAAQERALRERGNEYILPVRMDDVRLPGLSDVVGYVSFDEGPDKIARLVAGKIWSDPSAPKGHIGPSRYWGDE